MLLCSFTNSKQVNSFTAIDESWDDKSRILLRTDKYYNRLYLFLSMCCNNRKWITFREDLFSIHCQNSLQNNICNVTSLFIFQLTESCLTTTTFTSMPWYRQLSTVRIDLLNYRPICGQSSTTTIDYLLASVSIHVNWLLKALSLLFDRPKVATHLEIDIFLLPPSTLTAQGDRQDSCYVELFRSLI